MEHRSDEPSRVDELGVIMALSFNRLINFVLCSSSEIHPSMKAFLDGD